MESKREAGGWIARHTGSKKKEHLVWRSLSETVWERGSFWDVSWGGRSLGCFLRLLELAGFHPTSGSGVFIGKLEQLRFYSKTTGSTLANIQKPIKWEFQRKPSSSSYLLTSRLFGDQNWTVVFYCHEYWWVQGTGRRGSRLQRAEVTLRGKHCFQQV